MRGKPYATCSLGWTTQWHSDLTHIHHLHHCPWYKAENLKKNTEKGKPVALIKCRNQTFMWLLFWESVEMLSLIPCLNLGIWCHHVQWIVSVCMVHWAACCRPLLSICIHLCLLGYSILSSNQKSKQMQITATVTAFNVLPMLWTEYCLWKKMWYCLEFFKAILYWWN